MRVLVYAILKRMEKNPKKKNGIDTQIGKRFIFRISPILVNKSANDNKSPFFFRFCLKDETITNILKILFIQLK